MWALPFACWRICSFHFIPSVPRYFGRPLKLLTTHSWPPSSSLSLEGTYKHTYIHTYMCITCLSHAHHMLSVIVKLMGIIGKFTCTYVGMYIRTYVHLYVHTYIQRRVCNSDTSLAFYWQVHNSLYHTHTHTHTHTSSRVPLGGFSHLVGASGIQKFTITHARYTPDILPSTSTWWAHVQSET